MLFNLMFSSWGLSAFVKTLTTHLFGLAYTHTKRLQEDETQEGGSGGYSQVDPMRNRLQREKIHHKVHRYPSKETNNFLSNSRTYISVQQIVPDTHLSMPRIIKDTQVDWWTSLICTIFSINSTLFPRQNILL